MRPIGVTPGIRGLLATAVAVVAVVGVIWLTEFAAWSSGIGFKPFYVLRLALLLVAAVALLVGFVELVVRGRLGVVLRRLATVAHAMAFSLIVLEVGFMFVPRSHNVGYTLGARIWDRYYWRNNSLGYRDAEPAAREGVRHVLVVGDSFTAGGGQQQVEDRYTDVLAAELRGVQVFNLGCNGADTRAEFRRLKEFPISPDVLVLQYYVNDMEGVLAAAGRALPAFRPYEDVPVVLRPLVRDSFLANYVYWHFPHDDQGGVDQLLAAFRDEALLSAHLQDLERFVEYAEQRSVPLRVVVFPMLLAPELSAFAVGSVAAMFQSHGVPVLDVTDLVEDLDPLERVANRCDAHPSTLVHRRVGEALARMLASN